MGTDLMAETLQEKQNRFNAEMIAAKATMQVKRDRMASASQARSRILFDVLLRLQELSASLEAIASDPEVPDAIRDRKAALAVEITNVIDWIIDAFPKSPDGYLKIYKAEGGAVIEDTFSVGQLAQLTTRLDGLLAAGG